MVGCPLLPPGPYALVRGHALARTCGSVLAWGVFGAILWVMVQRAIDCVGGLLHDTQIAGASARRESSATWRPVQSAPSRSWKEQAIDWLLPTLSGIASNDLGGESRTVSVALPLVWSRLEDLPALALIESLDVDAKQESVTTSWHLVTRTERGVRLAIDLAMYGGVAWVVSWLARTTWRRARTAAHIAAHGAPCIGDARFEPAGRRWRLLVRWHGRNGVESLQVEQDPRHGAPFLVGPGQVLLLVDAERPHLALVLRQRLWPLRLAPGLVEEVCAQVAALHPEPLTIPRG